MAKDFVPQADVELSTWLKALKSSITNSGLGLGLDSTDVARVQQLCNEYTDQIFATHQARIAAASAVKAKQAMRKTHLKPLRNLINKMKTSGKFGRPNGLGMGVLSHKQEVDQTYMPKLKAIVSGDLIQVKFKKRGIEGMDFRVQINDGEWQGLGIRLHSPMYYKPEGFAQGAAIRCKFKGVAIKKDEHFGQWSGTISVLYEMP